MREESFSELTLGGPEEQYSLLMECVTDYAIFLMDGDGRVAAWNAGAERIFGYAEEEALGLPFDRFFTSEDVERGLPEKELHAAVTHGRATDDKWHVRKDGTRFWVSGITTALRDDDGGLRGFAKVTRDRTDRKAIEEALREADRRKDEFLAVLAHELRGPLAPVVNSLQVLRLQFNGHPIVDQAHDAIERQVKHLSRLVDDLLDVGRIKQGKLKLHKQALNLADVVAQAVEASRPHLDGRRHRLSVALAGRPIRLEGDPARLTQVFVNLLTNSAKYTPEGGQVWLTSEVDSGAAVVRVRDTGIGIAADMLPRIFELFAQVENGTDGDQGGLGIGLALVRSLVELHGGSVSVHSDGPDRGCEFIVRLPLLGHAMPETVDEEVQPAAPTPPCATTTCRILVVDDHRDAADSLAVLLKMFGHEVRVAYAGELAVVAAREFRPEVVLLDLGLPGMTGYDVALTLRAEPGLEKLFLVAVTGYGQEEDRRRTEEVGFDAYLLKPADLDELQALLVNAKL